MFPSPTPGHLEVQPHVVGVAAHEEIVASVVGAVAVDVVDDFTPAHAATQRPLDDQDVFGDVASVEQAARVPRPFLAGDQHVDIAVGGDPPAARPLLVFRTMRGGTPITLPGAPLQHPGSPHPAHAESLAAPATRQKWPLFSGAARGVPQKAGARAPLPFMSPPFMRAHPKLHSAPAARQYGPRRRLILVAHMEQSTRSTHSRLVALGSEGHGP